MEFLWAVFWSWLACPGFPQVTFIIKTVPKVTNKSDFFCSGFPKASREAKESPGTPKRYPIHVQMEPPGLHFGAPGIQIVGIMHHMNILIQTCSQEESFVLLVALVDGLQQKFRI